MLSAVALRPQVLGAPGVEPSPFDDVTADARELALRVSIAPRITAALLRAARLRHLRRAGPDVETELWFSSLIETRGTAAAVLDPEIARILRAELAAVPAEPDGVSSALTAAKMLADRCQLNAPALVRLETDLIWYAARRDSAAAAALDESLRSIVKTILSGSGRLGVARWAFGLRRRVPELKTSPLAALLEVVAKLSLRGNASTVDESTINLVSPGERALIESAVSGTVPTGVAFDGKLLTVRIPPASTDDVVNVPATNPIVLLADGVAGDSRIVLNGTTDVAVRAATSNAISLTTALGDRFHVSSLQAAVASLQNDVENSLVVVLGENGEALGCGTVVAADLVISAANPQRAVNPSLAGIPSDVVKVGVPNLVIKADVIASGGLFTVLRVDALGRTPIVRAAVDAQPRLAVVPTASPTGARLSWSGFLVEDRGGTRRNLIPSRPPAAGLAPFAGAPVVSASTDVSGAVGVCTTVAETGELVCVPWPEVDAYVAAVQDGSPGAGVIATPATQSITFGISIADDDADRAAAQRIEAGLTAAGHRIHWLDNEERAAVTALEVADPSAPCIVLLSAAYLANEAGQWGDSLSSDPFDRDGRFVLIRVADCDPTTLFRGMGYWDAVAAEKGGMSLETFVASIVPPASPEVARYRRSPPRNPMADVSEVYRVFHHDAQPLVEKALASAPARVCLVGGPGVGKSAVARAAAAAQIERFSLIWPMAGNGGDAGYAALGGYLVPVARPNANLAADARKWLNGPLRSRILLLLDDVEDPKVLLDVPAGADVIATSRRRSGWPPGIQTIPLGPLTQERAMAMLAIATAQVGTTRRALTNDDARLIVDAVTTIPAAVLGAAQALARAPSLPPRDVIAELTRAAAAPEPDSVLAVLSAALVDADELRRGAAAMLLLSALFAERDVPEEIFDQPAGLYAALTPIPQAGIDGTIPVVPAQREDALTALQAAGLIERSPTNRSFTLHPLVRAVGLALARNDQWTQCAAGALDAAWEAST